MKALTIWQPWASAIMAGVKRVENRTWSTDYRGPLAIHAGRRFDPEGLDVLEAVGINAQVFEHAPRGALLGAVDLVDVVRYPSPGPKQQSLPGDFDQPDPYRLEAYPLATGPYCWILRNPRPLPKPIPCPGRRGLWEVELPDPA